MPKTLTIAVAICISLVVAFGLTKQIFSALESGKRLDMAVEEVSKLQEENNKLQRKLTEVKNPDFIEKTARDKLNLARSNETIVIIEEESVNRLLGVQKKIEEVELPNWQGWLNLFLN